MEYVAVNFYTSTEYNVSFSLHICGTCPRWWIFEEMCTYDKVAQGSVTVKDTKMVKRIDIHKIRRGWEKRVWLIWPGLRKSRKSIALGKVETQFAMLLTDLKAQWPGNQCGQGSFVMTHDPGLCHTLPLASINSPRAKMGHQQQKVQNFVKWHLPSSEWIQSDQYA